MCFVNDTTFLFFKRLKSIVKTRFPAVTEALRGYDLRTGVCECILLDNDILGKWLQLTVATSISEHASFILLQLIADFYSIFRVFLLFATSLKNSKSTKNHMKGRTKQGYEAFTNRAGW